MNIFRDGARRQQHLNPLSTSVNNVQQSQSASSSSQTPSSATNLSSPFTSYNNSINSSAYTPVSAVRQYNPQQWGSPLAGSDRPQFARPSSDIEVPAPPPYSPPRSSRPSSVSPQDRSVNQNASNPAYLLSPSVSANPTQPSQYGSRSRASSREGTQSFPDLAPREMDQVDGPRLSPSLNREHVGRRPAPLNIHSPESTSNEYSSVFDARPPASRRAVSASAISTPSSSRSRGSSISRWEPGMPLPPPPPGPPPPHSRSQSMTRTVAEPQRMSSPPTRRPQATSSLGPVPPTPAGWVDDDVHTPGKSPSHGLVIDTSASATSPSTVTDSNSGSSSSGLSRSRAVRGEPKSIRERRSESRTGKSAPEETCNNPWAEAITPSDITVPPTTVLGRRPTGTKVTPRSSKSHHAVGTPNSAHTVTQSPALQPGSRGSTPRPLASSNHAEAPTPPFSPNPQKPSYKNGSPAVPPKSLPTPPPQSLLAQNVSPRPVSHILHIPNNDVTIPAPLTPARPISRQSAKSASSRPTPADLFAQSAIERHEKFARNEAAAATDGERVRLFADFIVSESRLRRERYSEAIGLMGTELLELTRDLFLPYSTSRRDSTNSRSSEWTPQTSAQTSHRGSISAVLHDNPQLQTPDLSSSQPPSPAVGRPESTWWTGYMPSLSPIPSMSVSEALDESSSRGRPSSRWWEVSQEGSTGAPTSRLERSKRESKYMGMPKELREALQYEEINRTDSPGIGGSSGPSLQKAYGENEYPPEKVQWHEEASSPAFKSSTNSIAPSSAPPTPDPRLLDVSRLVTLPPPYPRHHPAVNNNHPNLTSIRTIVRTLSDLTEVTKIKDLFTEESTRIKEEATAARTRRRNSLRERIRREIDEGSMTYADAAELEVEFKTKNHEATKAASKAKFESFQNDVVMPVNDMLMGRVHSSTELFEQLRSQLFVDAQEQSPNLTQEEGDEQPELLEKLTLLKWIFEAREALHCELYDLLTERNDRYRDVVITPYRLANNNAKVSSTQAFFAADTQKRKVSFEQESLKRTEEFMDVIEENVIRGVEVQLSAFWDIAPSLHKLTDKIPTDLIGFRIQIPTEEYEENPSYHDFPMQYLYSLLRHAEKSTYQFIESQTNLLCLLHEVKGGVTAANCRLMASQRIDQGEDEDTVMAELRDVEKDEESRLTDDLKQKVRTVEELWISALGGELKSTKGRIVNFLVQRGGWEDEED